MSLPLLNEGSNDLNEVPVESSQPNQVSSNSVQDGDLSNVSDNDALHSQKRKRKTKKKTQSSKSNKDSNSHGYIVQKSQFTDNFPSSIERYMHHVKPDHMVYQVVSRSVQTDWSWLRDEKSHAKEEQLEKEESFDFTEVKENLDLGLYGGFATINRGLEYERNISENDSAIGKLLENNKTKKQPVEENIETKPESNKDNCEAVSPDNRSINPDLQELPKKPKQRAKSAVMKTAAYDDSDLSDGCKSCSSIMNVKPVIPDIRTGPPEIIKYHRTKSATPRKSSVQEANELALPLAATQVLSGLFSGICQFCGKEIIDNCNNETLDQSYCCPEYEHFVNLNNDDEDDGVIEDELIDITPHSTFHQPVKITRKSNREKTSERVRERELERQRAANQQANLFSFAKQMKTIQYSLASAKCMEEGWTVKPKSPVPEEPDKCEELFQFDFNTTAVQKSEVLQQRYYDNGKPFLTIYPDGTGCCYYPSGHVALSIVSVEKGKYAYIVQKNSSYNAQEDSIDEAGILAVFEPNGVGICYYQKDGRLRLFVNAHGGIELDRKGGKRKRWQWYFIKGHVHAPPFQPICFPLNKYISIRLIDQHNIGLIFSSNKRTVRFNVAANVKAVKLDGFGRYEADKSESILQTTRKKISSILTQWHSCLRLPNSTRLDKLFPSIAVSSRKSKHLPPLDKDPSVVVN